MDKYYPEVEVNIITEENPEGYQSFKRISLYTTLRLQDKDGSWFDLRHYRKSEHPLKDYKEQDLVRELNRFHSEVYLSSKLYQRSNAVDLFGESVNPDSKIQISEDERLKELVKLR